MSVVHASDRILDRRLPGFEHVRADEAAQASSMNECATSGIERSEIWFA